MTVDIHSPQQSVSERRGQQLAPLQTNFSRPTARPVQVVPTRPSRPRPTDYQTDGESGERVPLQATPVKRQTSKSSLRNIFGREKSSRKQQPVEAKLSGIDEVHQHGTPAASETAPAPHSPTTTSTPKTIASTATIPTSPTASSLRPKLPAKSRTKSSEEKPPAGELGWKPPPLFQAYPQSIKHDCLPVPAMSVDAIMRLQATSKAKAGGSRDEEPSAEDPASRKKKEDKEKKRHMRTLSETINKIEWTQKVYVLATAGYILQYSGQGKHDRLPEKMLQLGPRSVAFASDAIPGKHWVLQVSQTDEDGVDVTKSHRFRFGFHRSHTRRVERCFLLVFDHPEDMSSWLLAVRAQIEARGGKKYVSEKAEDEDAETQLEAKSTVRQLVTKDPNRFSTLLQPQQSLSGEEKDPGVSDHSRRSSYVSLNRRSIVLPPAPESRSGSVSTTHTEITSPVSGTGTGRFYSSVPIASIPAAPSNGNAAAVSVESPIFTSPKRRSLHMPSPSTAKTAAELAAEIPRAQSTQPDPLFRSTSPPAPNFSVPSFSKRFTARFGPLQVPQTSQLPPALEETAGKDPPAAAALSSFPSPPQSPGKLKNGFPQEAANPQQWPLHQGQAKRPPLRASSSQDSLADPHRMVEPKGNRLSRLPRNMAPVPRPTTAVSEGPAPQPQFGPEGGNARREQSRPRGSMMYQPDPSARLPPVSMGRRKSMPGLIGPPAAPPPNCPLPKIPSPVDPQPPNWNEPPADLRQCISPPPLTTIREQRKSMAPALAGHGQSTPRSVSRQSRMPPI
ncbi:hypothetical protein BO70DRAFT_105409 [Aspergillus heteromorphus CBS 117.55]|uniref:Peptidase family M20/M25/M40 protein n=1 Tax=Aspergillus heteromorphus CBS 117.55 TaxID=1448321 RepID=A0A317VN70_9EURO|nr:uncharacterized protein BO70DRAFT_105409 [Aspergillus heteromorphus CBS 117.55]PWY74378.1 hypothetical protein BO70DRAFT_105409 [Aspergillus heteromorphus CBS 117.55]